MADRGIGDYFISDIDDEMLEEEDELIQAPVVVPHSAPKQVQPPQQRSDQASTSGPTPASVSPSATAAPAPPVVERTPAAEPVSSEGAAPSAPAPVPEPAAIPAAAPGAQPVRTSEGAQPQSREHRLATVLDRLMADSPEVQAAALVSMDGFTMASAMPEGMQEDRVGAMSAAILGLGERAAAELGRGNLTQVFIEGADGYVVLISAGPRAVLTALAQRDAKLGLVLYDMKATAGLIADILG